MLEYIAAIMGKYGRTFHEDASAEHILYIDEPEDLKTMHMLATSFDDFDMGRKYHAFSRQRTKRSIP
jgi:hypothetical protein